MAENGFISPLGYRIFTPDDWIVRIEYHDGTVFRKGVDPLVDREEAVRVALSAARSLEVPKNIDPRRRRDWNKVSA